MKLFDPGLVYIRTLSDYLLFFSVRKWLDVLHRCVLEYKYVASFCSRYLFDPKKTLKQITSGQKHLYALKLVHRDIKLQNTLVFEE